MAYSTINKSTDYFNTKLYTGTGATASITGVGFQPDLTWLKSRSLATVHQLYDVIRGATKRISSNDNTAEATEAGALTSFDSDGFGLGNWTSANGNLSTFVSWNWKANGAGSANTDGSVSSTVSVNATSKFSIVTWTGTGSVLTVGHGLGVVPKFILVKRLNATGDGVVYHESMGNAGGMEISSTGGYNAVSGWFNSTTPTSSVFTLGTNGNINTSTGTYVAYCFADVAGYSKFGSYVGNGVADGTFIYTGFKPSFVMVKNHATGNHWMMYDNKVIPYNLGDKLNRANEAAVEVTSATGEMYDFLSNGFKARASSNNNTNYGSNTYMYVAFGQPIISNSGICATAR
jgi:hypothetical protein